MNARGCARIAVVIGLLGTAAAMLASLACSARSDTEFASRAPRERPMTSTSDPQCTPPLEVRRLQSKGSGSISGSASPRVRAMQGQQPGDEELWVIARDKEIADSPCVVEPTAGTNEDTPGTGALMAHRGDAEELVPCPLKHTDVSASIAGYIATVDVTQQFHNPWDSKIEAVYGFPLPQNAAVNGFVMTIGDRKIRGIIREREEAERIYRQARSQGYVASLLTQERPNIFTQKVANIEPGKQIDVNIKYFHTLAYEDGYYSFVFPMTVGPRFNPPGSTDGIGAVGRGEHGTSGQSTEIQYLRPGERTGHDIALNVSIDAGVSIDQVTCNTHAVDVSRPSPTAATVKLCDHDTIPNRDFVLRYKVGGRELKTGLVTHRDRRGGFFTLMLYPPDAQDRLPHQPLELVFVLDCSGSMSGEPIAQVKDAVRHALDQLTEHDTFQVIRFSQNASKFGRSPVRATERNVRRAIDYVNGLSGGGGTMMIEGIKAALDFPHDDNRLRFVAFLTDGYIGNETEILGEIHKRLGASRIFSFGVGSAPNRFLMDRMAKIGRGTVAYLNPDDDGADVMDAFLNRVRRPALRDIEIDFGGMQASCVYPEAIADLFVGRPVILSGRFNGRGETTVRVRGRVGNESVAFDIPADLDDSGALHDGIAAVWARTRIADLADRAAYDPDAELPNLIRQTALEYGLVSAFTAFVAVDSTSHTAGDHGTSVAVPVSVPQGVRYETTVSE